MKGLSLRQKKNSPSLLNNPGIFERSIPQTEKKFPFFIE